MLKTALIPIVGVRGRGFNKVNQMLSSGNNRMENLFREGDE